jgi:uncharacterized protein with von Willebrand factor type A (vWA) domain
MFVLDTSHSLNDEDFTSLKKFANAIINGLRNQGTRVEVGVIKFGVNAETEIDVDNNLSRAELEDAINSIKHTAEFGTNTHLGLNLARRHLKDYSPCACTYPKAIVLLTDGYPSYASSAFVEARVARELGLHLFVVAVGEDSNFQGATKEDLAATFTDGDKRHVARVKKTTALQSFVDEFIKDMCGGRPKSSAFSFSFSIYAMSSVIPPRAGWHFLVVTVDRCPPVRDYTDSSECYMYTCIVYRYVIKASPGL